MEGTIPGLPPQYAGIATVVIGLLSSLLVAPLTAIAKKLGRTTGPTTVMISAALSLIVGLLFTMYTLAVSGNLTASGVFIAVIAFLKSNGDYLTKVNANAKGNKEASKEAPPVVVANPYVPSPLPPTGVPLGPEYFAPAPGDPAPAPKLTVE